MCDCNAFVHQEFKKTNTYQNIAEVNDCFLDKIPEQFLENYNLILKIPTGEVEKHQVDLKEMAVIGFF